MIDPPATAAFSCALGLAGGLAVCLTLVHPSIASAEPHILLAKDPLFADVYPLPKLHDASSPLSPAALRINASLQHHEDTAVRLLKPCDDPSLQSEVTYQSAKYLSLQIFAGAYCPGAAHPWFSTEALTFDLASGSLVNWPNLFGVEAWPYDPTGQILTPPRALQAAYRSEVLPDAPAECHGPLSGGDTFGIWLVQRENGAALALEPVFLAYVHTPCLATAYFDAGQATSLGLPSAVIALLEN